MKTSEIIIVLMYTLLFVLCVHSAFGSWRVERPEPHPAVEKHYTADSAAALPRAWRPAAHSSSAAGAAGCPVGIKGANHG